MAVSPLLEIQGVRRRYLGWTSTNRSSESRTAGNTDKLLTHELYLVMTGLRRHEELLRNHIGGEGNYSNAKSGKHLADHSATLEDGMFPPSLSLGPRVTKQLRIWERICHLYDVHVINYKDLKSGWQDVLCKAVP